MKIKLQRKTSETEATFRISSTSREFDGPKKGGLIVRMWRCPTERPGITNPDEVETLTLTLEAHEVSLIGGKFTAEPSRTFTLRSRS